MFHRLLSVVITSLIQQPTVIIYCNCIQFLNKDLKKYQMIFQRFWGHKVERYFPRMKHASRTMFSTFITLKAPSLSFVFLFVMLWESSLQTRHTEISLSVSWLNNTTHSRSPLWQSFTVIIVIFCLLSGSI